MAVSVRRRLYSPALSTGQLTLRVRQGIHCLYSGVAASGVEIGYLRRVQRRPPIERPFLTVGSRPSRLRTLWHALELTGWHVWRAICYLACAGEPCRTGPAWLARARQVTDRPPDMPTREFKRM